MGIHQLHIEHVALLLLCTLLTVANSWIYKEVKGIHWFSLYNVSTLLGAAAVALRGVIPDFLSIVVGNSVVVLGFAILLPHTSIEAATEITERLRSSIEDLEIVHGPVRTRVTASLGLAPVEMSAPDWDNLLMRCDQALYAVKRKGGNGHSVVPPTLRVATEAT